jgi:hypothetical protein
VHVWQPDLGAQLGPLAQAVERARLQERVRNLIGPLRVGAAEDGGHRAAGQVVQNLPRVRALALLAARRRREIDAAAWLNKRLHAARVDAVRDDVLRAIVEDAIGQKAIPARDKPCRYQARFEGQEREAGDRVHGCFRCVLAVRSDGCAASARRATAEFQNPPPTTSQPQ